MTEPKRWKSMWPRTRRTELVHSVRTTIAAVLSLVIARYAGITLAIVMLVARAQPAWVIAIHRFIEISLGIVVGLLLTAVWPESQPNPEARPQP